MLMLTISDDNVFMQSDATTKREHRCSAEILLFEAMNEYLRHSNLADLATEVMLNYSILLKKTEQAAIDDD